MSSERWQKNTMNVARTRKQKRDANNRYQELNKEVQERQEFMWNQKLRKLRRLEREVMQGLCTRSPES